MKKSRVGFSLIEVMLVLALVFLLFTAMMMVIQSSINRQRYNDTVTSLKEFIQRQYSEVQNVAIDDGVKGISKCDNVDKRGVNRGRTNCYVVGRLLNFGSHEGNARINVHQIVYYSEGDTNIHTNLKFNDFNLTDASILNGRFETYGIEVENYQVEWGAVLKTPGTPSSRIDGVSVLIFRSPETGAVRTHVYSGMTQPENLSSILTDSTSNVEFNMCVVPDRNPNGELRAVRINAGATNASAVEVPTPGSERADCVYN